MADNEKNKGPDAEQVEETEQSTDDTASYGAYEAETFGPEGDASKN